MSDVFLRALQTYLKGDEWKHSIEIFVNANCKDFAIIDEMNHQHHALWKTFQEIVENILEMAMECAGGSIDSLEKELAKIVKEAKPRGPSEARILEVIDRLLCFDDFHAFAMMMHNAFNEQHGEIQKYTPKVIEISRKGKAAHDAVMQKQYEENYYALYQMGYSDDDLFAVMNANRHDLTIEEWIVKLNEYAEEKHHHHHEHSEYGHHYGTDYDGYGNASEGKHNDEHDEYYKSESKFSDDNRSDHKETKEEWEDPAQFDHDDDDNSKPSPAAPLVRLAPVVQSFVSAAQIADGAEFNAKFTLAESIRDTFDSTNTADTSEAMKKMIQWSSDMLTLRKDMDAAFDDGVHFHEYNAHCRTGLVDWYYELEAARREIDESSLGTHMMSDAEIQKMIELDTIAGLGTEDEQYLHTLISRHDTVTRDIKKIYFNINVMVNTDRHITRAHIEEVYVFLKGQVANNSNLDDIADELFEFVSNRISSVKSGEVLTYLLDLHLLEDEEDMLKKKIQQIAGGETEEQQHFHEGEEGFSKLTADEAAALSHAPMNWGDEFDHFGAGDNRADAKLVDEGGDPYGARSDEKGQFKQDAKHADSMASSSAASGGLSMAADKKHLSDLPPIDFKGSKSSSSSFAAAAPSSFAAAPVEPPFEFSSVSSKNNSDALLNALKDKHKSSLFNLKNTLEAEKSKKLKDLEAKLAKRRQKIKELKALGGLDGDEQNLLEQKQNELLVISDQIAETSNKYNSLITNMVSGYRKKCLAELKLAKKNLASGGSGALSAADMEGINKDLTAQILSRFERDTQSLLDNIEGDRVASRNKLLLKLAKKKAKVGEDPSDKDKRAIAKLERSTAEAIEKLDKTTSDQVAQVLMDSQTSVLNTLSALNLEDAVLINKSRKGDEEGDEEEDDFYFDEETSNNNKLAAWLERMGTIQENYLSASKQIQFKLNYVNNDSIQAQDEALMESLITGSVETTQQTIEQLENAASGKTDASAGGAGGGEGVDSTYSNVTSHMMKVVVDAYNQQVHTDEDLHNIGEGVVKGPGRTKNKGEREEGEDSETEMRRIRIKEKEADTSQVREAIFAEFKRTKADYDNVMNVSRANNKQRLIDRRNQSRAAAAAAAGIKGPETSLLESVVDSFLENPLSNEVEYKEQVTALITPRPMTRGLQRAIQDRYHDNGHHNESKDNSGDKDRIKAEHIEKEKILEDDLYANMLAKKKKLEDRLAKKRAQADKAQKKMNSWTDGEDDAAITAAALRRQEQEAQDKLEALEKAFETVQSMLQTASKEEMSQFDLKTLINLMEQKSNGVDISAASLVSGSTKVPAAATSESSHGSNSSNIALTTVRDEESESAKSSSPVVTTARNYSKLPPIVTLSKEELEEQAKRISYSYNEENQKQDLMMKIKETRQRQKLQRKLLEKKQNQAQNLHDAV